MDDPVADALAELGHAPGPDALRALDELLRHEPAAARKLAAGLAKRLARLPKAEAARATLALGSVNLALGEAALARDLLIEAAALVPEADRPLAARAALKLAAAELAAGRPPAARLQAARALPELAAARDPELLQELARVLEGAGDSAAATAISHLARAQAPREDRALVLARLVGLLNSCAAGTAEPLFLVLRAVIDESRAARGLLMLYEGASLRFELGLTRTGRRLSADDFACSTTVVDRALETGKPVLVPDLAATLPFALASSAHALGIRSALCAPLRLDRRRSGAAAVATIPAVKGIAGVLYVDSGATGSFDDEDARFFEALADAAVLALRAAGGKPLREAPRENTQAVSSFGAVSTRAPSLRAALELCARVAPTNASVVLRGESGTGKELLARALHERGARAQGPFVAVDCGAMAETLVQHELFGHEAGAFTGAGAPRAGLIERAHGGTLFLDEVGDMPPGMQAALLRVLQEGEVRRLGGEAPRRVDVRLVSATQHDLAALVEQGTFRQDLLFRLAVVEVRVPPLRERREDLEDLARAVLAKIAAEDGRPLELAAAAVARLAEHPWPGNVRELENVLRAASLGTRGDVLGLGEVDAALGGRRGPPPAPAPPPATAAQALDGTIEAIERRAIEDRLARLGWNQVRVAESLGLDRTTLRRKITRYGIVRGP